MNFLSILILILFFYTNSALACDVININFKLCNTSELCQNNLYLNENINDITTFGFLYNRFMNTVSNRATIESWICSNYNETNFFLTYDITETVWIDFFGHYKYCINSNEYFDSFLGACVCKTDKVCKYTHPFNVDLHFVNYEILASILYLVVVATVIFGFVKIKHIISLANDINQKIKETK